MKQTIPIDVHGRQINVSVNITDVELNETKFQTYSFHGGETHADYHYIEENDLVYIYTDNSGNDYWDIDTFYVKREFEELGKEYFQW